MTIINPWIFYLIDVLVNINDLCVLAIFILLIALGAYAFVVFLSESKMSKKVFKTCVVLLVISGVVASFIPSEETCYKMLISSVVTTDNLETASDVIRESVDYIFEFLEKGDTNE